MSITTRGWTIMILGAVLRLTAHAIAWPRNFSFSGPPESTSWGIMETALSDIGTGLFYLGGLLYVGAHLIRHHAAAKAADGGAAPPAGP